MRWVIILLSFCLCMSSPAKAQDMRAASKKAERDREAAEEAARAAEARILDDRKALLALHENFKRCGLTRRDDEVEMQKIQPGWQFKETRW